MALHTGDKAPDFSLYSSDKQLVHLQDFRGKNVVLLFFPLAFTGTCTAELCSTRDDIGIYRDLEAEILAISIDTPQSLARYKQEYQFNFTLLSDFNKEVIRAYDVMYEEFSVGLRGVAKRAVFLIDPEGIIRYMEVLEKAGNMPDLPALQEALRNLQMA
ncbi:MAG TPA: redoxin domain-containing protein [Saprospiraceae bacterium]|nr:redoxin domain-containing protein [Saprospiraceae bacterium]